MFKDGLFFVDVPKMLNNFKTQHLSQMLLRAFRESEIFNNTKHMSEMLLVFDGLNNFNIPQSKQNGNRKI